MAFVSLSIFLGLLSSSVSHVRGDGRFLGSKQNHNHSIAAHGPEDLLAELEQFGHASTPEGEKALELRAQVLTEALEPIFRLAPKDGEGRVDSRVARYALRRLFMLRHGWSINGVERRSALRHNSSKIGEALETGGHFSLRQLGRFAATLELLVHAENEKRLKEVFDHMGFSLQQRDDAAQASKVIEAYMALFLMRNSNPVRPPKLALAQKYVHLAFPNWADQKAFAENVRTSLVESGELASSGSLWETSLAVVEEIGERYGRWQNKDCLVMRDTLEKMATPNTGRVPLSAFWQPLVEGSDWMFTESAPYLDQLGALEGTDQAQSVIIPNYVYSQANCVVVSRYYDTCCINECETLMSKIEEQVQSAAPSVDEVASIVAALPSRTVAAPRALPAALLRRLEGIAAHHGGVVPLHGRLFSQFLHHTFPNECPYPVFSETDGPVNLDNWILQQHKSAYVNKTMAQAYIEAFGKVTIGEERAEEESADMPWTDEEELFLTSRVYTSDGALTGSQASVLKSVAALLVPVIAVVIAFWVKSSNLLVTESKLTRNYHV